MPHVLIRYTFVLFLWLEIKHFASALSPLQDFEWYVIQNICKVISTLEIIINIYSRYTADVPEATEDDSSAEYDCYTLDGPHQAACSEDIPIQLFKEEFSSELVTDYLLECCKENADNEISK